MVASTAEKKAQMGYMATKAPRVDVMCTRMWLFGPGYCGKGLFSTAADCHRVFHDSRRITSLRTHQSIAHQSAGIPDKAVMSRTTCGLHSTPPYSSGYTWNTEVSQPFPPGMSGRSHCLVLAIVHTGESRVVCVYTCSSICARRRAFTVCSFAFVSPSAPSSSSSSFTRIVNSTHERSATHTRLWGHT